MTNYASGYAAEDIKKDDAVYEKDGLFYKAEVESLEDKFEANFMGSMRRYSSKEFAQIAKEHHLELFDKCYRQQGLGRFIDTAPKLRKIIEEA